MELNIASIFYLFFRLSPMLVVSYYVFLSIFNSDIKGLFYLGGLFFTLILTVFASRFNMFKIDDLKSQCKSITFGSEMFSYFPLSQSVLVYTLLYIIIVVYKYNTWNINMPTFLLLGSFIIFDFIWNIRNGCSNFINMFATWSIAGIVGFFWTITLISTGYDLVFFHGVSDANVCKMNTNNFRCRLKK